MLWCWLWYGVLWFYSTFLSSLPPPSLMRGLQRFVHFGPSGKRRGHCLVGQAGFVVQSAVLGALTAEALCFVHYLWSVRKRLVCLVHIEVWKQFDFELVLRC